MTSLLLLLACSSSPTTSEAPPAEPRAEAAPAVQSALLARHPTEGRTPEGALRLWLEACLLWNTDEDSAKAALQYLTVPLKEHPDWPGLNSNHTFVERLTHAPHIFRSYARGTSPTGGYALPDDWELDVVEVKDKDARGTPVVLRSSGADNPRPVYLRQSSQTGLWYVDNWANVYVDIRPPVDPGVETFE